MAFTEQDLDARFDLDGGAGFEVRARYNVAPGQNAPVVVMREGRRRLEAFRWGLVPSWSGDDRSGARMINARSETARQSRAFAAAFSRRRCLVPASGFFEWRAETRSRKIPFHFHLKGLQPFAFAGLWEEWRPHVSAPPLFTFAILTTDANDLVRPVHARMPVILAREHEAAWLDPGQTDPAALQDLLRPFPARDMERVQVSPLVNSPANDSPECIRPAPAQAGLFPD